MDTIPNHMGALIYGGVSVTLKRAFSFTLGTKALSSLLGVARTMYEALLFFIETLAIYGIQPTIVFCPTITLCEGGGTLLRMVIVPKELSGTTIFPQHIIGINQTNVSKVHIKSWHVQAMAKF